MSNETVSNDNVVKNENTASISIKIDKVSSEKCDNNADVNSTPECIAKLFLAMQLYTKYCEAIGGKDSNGLPLPSADEFFKDEGSAVIWLNVAELSADFILRENRKNGYEPKDFNDLSYSDVIRTVTSYRELNKTIKIMEENLADIKNIINRII